MARLAGSLGRDPPIRIMLYNHNARKGAATTSQNFTVVEFDALQLSNTVFPHTISVVTVYKCAETIQGKKLFKGGNYSRAETTIFPHIVSSLE